MAFTVRVAYEDGSVRSVARLFPDIASTAAFALRLADDIGRTYTAYRTGPSRPRAVAIHHGPALALEIRIFDGGLSPKAEFAGLVPLLSDEPL